MDTQFEPLDIIGTSSLGIIYKVRSLHNGLIVARKELNYGSDDSKISEQFHDSLNHRHSHLTHFLIFNNPLSSPKLIPTWDLSQSVSQTLHSKL